MPLIPNRYKISRMTVMIRNVDKLRLHLQFHILYCLYLLLVTFWWLGYCPTQLKVARKPFAANGLEERLLLACWAFRRSVYHNCYYLHRNATRNEKYWCIYSMYKIIIYQVDLSYSIICFICQSYNEYTFLFISFFTKWLHTMDISMQLMSGQIQHP